MKYSKIAKVEVDGLLEVDGVFNYNRPEKVMGLSSNGKSVTVKMAKKDSNGVDYTSSNVLRYLMFQQEFPKQLSTKELMDELPKMAGSVAGLIRGFLEAKTGLKKTSSIYVADAYTTKETRQKLTTEVGRSSKPQETGLVSDSKHKKGEEAKDTSMFNRESASKRNQKLNVVIKIDELQRAVLQNITKKDTVEETLKNLTEDFKNYDIPGDVLVTKTTPALAKMASPEESILFSEEQTKKMIEVICSKIASISGEKKDSRIQVLPSSLKVKLYTQGSLVPVVENMDFSEFVKLLNSDKLTLAQFWKETK